MKIILLSIAGIYAAVCVLAFVLQARLVYFPNSEEAGTPADVGLDYRDVTFRNRNGTALHGWFIPNENAQYTMLYLHGNAGNITHRTESIRQFHSLGLAIFIFDYSGFGKSAGRPGERATYLDADAAWDHLTVAEGIAPERIILFGRSLGGAVAIELATNVDPAAMIVESCFTSIPELGARVYPWLPIKFIARYRYDSLSRVPEIRVPKLFIHSLDDETVPFGMGKRLYNRAHRPKQFMRIRGGHNDAFVSTGEPYEVGIRRFIEALSETRRPG